MRKAEIIEVDLGQTVESILSDDLREVSAGTKAEIEKAVAEKAGVAAERAERVSQKSKQEMNIQKALQRVYTILLTAHNEHESVGIDILLEASSPEITNSSALVSRMKRFLHSDGNKFVINRRMKNKKPVYELLVYNTESSEVSPAEDA